MEEMKGQKSEEIRSMAQFKRKYLPKLAERELKNQEVGSIWAMETIQKLKALSKHSG